MLPMNGQQLFPIHFCIRSCIHILLGFGMLVGFYFFWVRGNSSLVLDSAFILYSLVVMGHSMHNSGVS